MGRIYSTAEKVIAWVGEEDEGNASFAMEMIKEAESQRFSVEYFRELFLDVKYDKHFRALVELHKREYWYRVWVVHEIYFAKNAILLCGRYSITWPTLTRFEKTLMDECTNYIETSKIDTSFLASCLRNSGPKGLPCPGNTTNRPANVLLNTLEENRSKMASDPRDKVFSLLGITNCESSGHNRLQIDYSRSVKDVYTGVVQAVVETTRCLDIICFSRPNVLINQGEENDKCAQPEMIPSWTPDWSVYPYVVNFKSNEKPFRAAGYSHAHVAFSSEEDILTAKGFCLGSISLCGAVCNPEDRSDHTNSFIELIRCVNGWRKNILNIMGGNDSTAKAFFRILYANFTEPSLETHLFGQFLELMEICTAMEILGAAFFESRFRSYMRSAETKSFPLFMYVATGGRRFISFPLDIHASTELVSSHSVTESSDIMIGLGPNTAKKGDKICILLGCNIPVVIRPKGDHYIFIGEAFIHGAMYGELMERLNEGKSEPQSFSLH
jgi:hypothetical protein